jgi:phosphatidylglycerol:prolipoprotein diacylglycerol transferase
MWPTLYTQQTPFGELPYNTWGLMIMLAFLAAALVAGRRVARVGIDPDIMSGMVGLSAASGLAGARLLHFLMSEDRHDFFDNPLIYFNLARGGFAFYGGFIAAGVLGVLYARSRGADTWKFADAVGPTVMVGLAVGRLGCFFGGCCHGATFTLPHDAHALLPVDFSGGQLYGMSEFPWLGMVMTKGVGVRGVPVYPTQLWEAAAAMVIFALASLSFRYRKFDGQSIATVLILYSLWRPINESLRGDSVRGTLDFLGMALTTSQIVSIFVGFAGLGLVVVGLRRGFRPETPWVFPGVDDATEDLGSAPRL